MGLNTFSLQNIMESSLVVYIVSVVCVSVNNSNCDFLSVKL